MTTSNSISAHDRLSNFLPWYQQSQQEAATNGISRQELDWLITDVVKIDKLALRLQQVHLERSQLIQLDALWQQRIQKRIPVQYLAGKVNWRDLELTVSPAVLIPRPETELIVDLVIDFVRENTSPDFATGNWVDLGTGSGAIAIALSQALPHSTIHAVDCSAEALAIAELNANIAISYQPLSFSAENPTPQALHPKPLFYLGNWFEPLTHLKAQVTGMISNPPYIPSHEIENLQPEVREHEPLLALDGGDDGLDSIRYLVNTAPAYLISGGYWLVEIMAGQAEMVRSLLELQGSYTQIKIHQDLAGCDRFVSAVRKIR